MAVAAQAREINLVQNPGFESVSATPTFPDGYVLQGAAHWDRLGGADEITSMGIIFPGDAPKGGAVSHLVRGIDQAKGRWLTFRFRGRAEDGFAITGDALKMKVERSNFEAHPMRAPGGGPPEGGPPWGQGDRPPPPPDF